VAAALLVAAAGEMLAVFGCEGNSIVLMFVDVLVLSLLNHLGDLRSVSKRVVGWWLVVKRKRGKREEGKTKVK
jgi:hypothetical protein